MLFHRLFTSSSSSIHPSIYLVPVHVPVASRARMDRCANPHPCLRLSPLFCPSDLISIEEHVRKSHMYIDCLIFLLFYGPLRRLAITRIKLRRAHLKRRMVVKIVDRQRSLLQRRRINQPRRSRTSQPQRIRMAM